MTAEVSRRTDAPERRKRPRDRKEQILAAAAERFWTHGYHQVGMADIAGAVGIAPSALYRHFRSKQEILIEILDEHLGRLERLGADPDRDLIEGIAALALDHREFGLLWEREARYLPDDDRRSIQRRLRALADVVAAPVSDRETADLRAWAAMAALDSPSRHRTQVDRRRFEQLLCAGANAVIAAPVPHGSTPTKPTHRQTPALAPASRREALLAAAIRLFSERGYPSVGLIDIGAAAGIAGPSVYNHFDSKIDVLTAALTRGNEALWVGLHRALATASGPADALERLVADYTAFATADSDIVRILMSELIHLPDEPRTALRRAEVDYLAEWVVLLTGARPELTDADARVLVQAAMAMINSVSQISHMRTRPHLTEQLAALAMAILTASGW